MHMQTPRGFDFSGNANQFTSPFKAAQKVDFEAVLKNQQEKLQRFAKQAEGFVFGAIGGASGTAALYPAESTKMRMQAATAEKVRGFLPTFSKTMRGEGVAGLYRGLKGALMGVAPEKAIMIGMNQALRKATSKHQDAQGRLPVGLELVIGSLSGLGQVAFSSPKEMLMIQMQLAGPSTAAAQVSPLSIVQKLGVRGLYQGASATALREIPFAALYFTAYSQFKGALLGERESLPFHETLACATAAAAPACLVTMPADVLKTRMQAQAGQLGRLSLGAMSKRILQQGGAGAFFVGAAPRVLMKAPQLGVALLVVETLSNLANPSPAPPPSAARG